MRVLLLILGLGVAVLSSSALAQAPPKPPKPPASKSRVVCGMTVISPDPNIDRKMLVKPPAKGTEFIIRAVPPAACK